MDNKMDNEQHNNNLNKLNTFDSYETEYKYIIAMINNSTEDSNIFGGYALYKCASLTNNLLHIFNEIVNKHDDIGDLKSTLNKMSHELHRLHDRNTQLMNDDPTWIQ